MTVLQKFYEMFGIEVEITSISILIVTNASNKPWSGFIGHPVAS